LALNSGREADHSPPSCAEVKECVELYFHSPNTPSGRGAQLKKHKDNFNFTFFIHFAQLWQEFVASNESVINEYQQHNETKGKGKVIPALF
jgi:hypothetical protein